VPVEQSEAGTVLTANRTRLPHKSRPSLPRQTAVNLNTGSTVVGLEGINRVETVRFGSRRLVHYYFG
jgi:hypothetical protein